MFQGAQEFLLHRIINKMPPSFRRLVDNLEVITRPKVTQTTLVIKSDTDRAKLYAAQSASLKNNSMQVNGLGFRSVLQNKLYIHPVEMGTFNT